MCHRQGWQQNQGNPRRKCSTFMSIYGAEISKPNFKCDVGAGMTNDKNAHEVIPKAVQQCNQLSYCNILHVDTIILIVPLLITQSYYQFNECSSLHNIHNNAMCGV